MQLPQVVSTVDGPQAEPHGPGILASLLAELEETLHEVGVPIGRWLQKGLDRESIKSKLANAGLGAPEELITLYEWRNGCTDVPFSRAVLPRFPFCSLEIALAYYRETQRVIRAIKAGGYPGLPVEDYVMGAGEGWLRLVNEAYGCAVYCQEPPSTSARLHYFNDYFDSDSSGVYCARSLCTLVTWWLEGIRAGAYRWDADRQLWDENLNLAPESQRAAGFL